MPPASVTSGSQYCSAATSRPRTTPSTAIRICTPWQIVKIGLPVSWKWRTSACTRLAMRVEFRAPRPRRLDALVEAGVCRAAAARAIDGVVVLGPRLGKSLVEDVVVSKFLGVGL